MQTLKIENIKVGDKAGLQRSFSAEEVTAFSRLSGDINPVHLDEEYASNTMFGSRIVHGALASSIFSTIFANTLPGPGCIYLKSENKFLKPVYLNDIVDYQVEVVEINSERKKVIFETRAFINGKTCIAGTAELYIPGE
ncbi:MaoC family dehydratase [Acinetobacter chinensis]|uniref:MaoC family dehydratase n=1 Tax=Acinetobacter chinensis TaxID=2004650 RepID=A0ABU3WHI1_9GAMM|nr:MaoC family dehydratase [Acinetobacter chinensis]MDV2469862.1 MaoC family dehydratase [Acinetobacter chinensis]